MRHVGALHSSRSLSQFTAQGRNNQEGGVSCDGNNLSCTNPNAGSKASGHTAQPPQQQLHQDHSAGDTYNSGVQCTGTTNKCPPPAAVVEPIPAQGPSATGAGSAPADNTSQGQRQVCSGNASCARSTGSGNTLVQTFKNSADQPRPVATAPSPGQAPAAPVMGSPMLTVTQSCVDKAACASTAPGGVVAQNNGRR